MKRLRLILGDQLNAHHSWYREKDPDTLYLIAELRQETDYTRHHIQKVVAFFIAMQQFAQALERSGHQVRYLTLDETQDWADLPALIQSEVQRWGATRFEYQRPDEWRLLGQLRGLTLAPDIEVQEYDSEHFLLPFEQIAKEFKSGKVQRMEAFYRRMRKRHGYLMLSGEPEGGQWNFDADNRKSFKKEDLAQIPAPLCFAHPTTEVVERLARHGVSTLGEIQSELPWPCTRREALQLLDFFCERCLPRFGKFQDAMTDQSPHAWSLYHSRLSFALNAKMISPAQVIERAIDAYRQSDGTIDLAQIEGFVRQILGWREFIRGLYWANMPEYASMNALEAQRPLPDYFWSGKTGMNCMKRAIGQSLKHAYAHHIQRLMVTGNFCLMAGIHPDEVDAWYLGIYIDAIEWVEMPNTRGMTQFADGGLVASKPYTGSGQYINRMSDYCKSCAYDVKKRSESNACPFNSLYWHFMERHRERFERNPRIGMIYKNWDKKKSEERDAILARAEWCLENLNEL